MTPMATMIWEEAGDAAADVLGGALGDVGGGDGGDGADADSRDDPPRVDIAQPARAARYGLQDLRVDGREDEQRPAASDRVRRWRASR
ncbi:hypothetical protein CERSUDRAFT_101477 [Gelatoporia subvermispora B]|uniref:Uncharacterized protein n=1 Tax=Ceriporiopsis subvermispora (strain B) TaxID=914234 RepID=M2Q0H9_CERS8|nr:hypothetical protein CERSUDRAFT_101477 [Gelatoporia subvermispora B]